MPSEKPPRTRRPAGKSRETAAREPPTAEPATAEPAPSTRKKEPPAPQTKKSATGTASPRSASRSASPASPAPGPHGQKRGQKRAEKTAARREAILRAALDLFTEHGFSATRLDDVAARAGVAKGTIYLYFQDKDALFQELIAAMMGPLIADLKTLSTADLPPRAAIEHLVSVFAKEVLGTERRRVLRLVLAEGPRFPRVAEFHFRNVVEPAIAAVSALMKRAAAEGVVHPRLAEYPQLVIAPGLMSVVWGTLFDRFMPLDAEKLLGAHLDVLFGQGERQ